MYFLIVSILAPPVDIKQNDCDQNASLYSLVIIDEYSFFISLDEADL